MELIRMSCPACGAPVHFSENALVVLCVYCHTQVACAQDEAPIDLEQACQALKNIQYEQAALCFGEILRHNPQDTQAWLGRAVATAFKPYGSASEALAFLQESRFSDDEAAAWLAQLATASSTFFDDCLRRYQELAVPAARLSTLVLEGALRSQNPAHLARIAETYTRAAEQAWQAGKVDQAISYMRQALKLDPNQRPQNLWLLELTQKA